MDSAEMRLVGEIYEIPRAQIRPFANQPRTYFDPDELAALAESIKEHGQLIAGEVRRLPAGERHRFELIDGQRRWHATGMAGLKAFRATIVEVGDEKQQYLRSIGTNFGRAEHTELEIAEAVRKMRTQFGMTIEKVATVFGKSQGWVLIYDGLNDLDDTLKPFLSKGISRDQRIDLVTAKKLAKLPRNEQVQFANEVLSNPEFSKAKKAVLLHDRVTAQQSSPKSTANGSVISVRGGEAIRTTYRRGKGQIAHDNFRQVHTLLRRTSEQLEAQNERDLGSIFATREIVDLKDLQLFCQIGVEQLQKIEKIVVTTIKAIQGNTK